MIESTRIDWSDSMQSGPDSKEVQHVPYQIVMKLCGNVHLCMKGVS